MSPRAFVDAAIKSTPAIQRCRPWYSNNSKVIITFQLSIVLSFRGEKIKLRAPKFVDLLKSVKIKQQNIIPGIFTWTSNKFVDIQREALNTHALITMTRCWHSALVGTGVRVVGTVKSRLDVHHKDIVAYTPGLLVVFTGWRSATW